MRPAVAHLVCLRPHAPVAERVLLPGDPGRALRLAQWLIDGPKMLNHHRGLWGYSGPARADGALLTVQAAGLGGPSAAVVVGDLVALGARRIVRVGSARRLAAAAPGGALLLAAPVIGADGTSRALGAHDVLEPDAELAAGLEAAGVRRGGVVSLDVLEAPVAEAARDAVAKDLASAAVLAAAGQLGVAAASVVILLDGPGPAEPLTSAAFEDAEREAGEVGLAALG